MPGDKIYDGNEGSVKIWKFTPGVDAVVSVIDKRHFMHGKVNLLRYELEAGTEMAARNLALVDDIRENGVESPGMIWWHNDLGHIISGTRRWNALEMANTLLRAESLDPRSMKFEINSRWDETTAREKWRRANQYQPNDILTRLEGAALDVDRGVSMERAAEVWDFSEAQLQKALQPKGILDGAEELKEALASGAIKLTAALKLCGMNKDEQRAALTAGKQGRSKSTEPKAVRVPVLKRLYDELVADKNLHGLTAANVVAVLMGGEPASDAEKRVKEFLADSSKPGRKSEKKAVAEPTEPKSGSEFTEAEREMIQANNNKDIDAIEAAEEKKSKRQPTRVVLDEPTTEDEED